MFRSLSLARLVVVVCFAVLLGHSVEARAQDEDEVATPEEIVIQPDARDTQEIGATLGMALGGSMSPGGLAVAGRYLYRLSDDDWLESGVGFSFGSSAAACYRDRASEYVCDHGLLDGFAGEGSVGVRRYFAGQKEFRPFAKLGLGLRLVSFSGDDVLGVSVPVLVSGGVRAQVASRVLIVVDATLRAGPAFLNQNLGIQPSVALSIGAGVEFTLESNH